MRRSLRVSLIATFASLHTVLYLLSFGLWRNWGIYLAPVEAIVLGPEAGCLAALIGSITARIIRFDSAWMFGIVAEPLSVLLTGFVIKTKWKPAMAIYAIMLSAYFLHPLGRALPVWTILDVLLAFALIFPAARLSRDLLAANAKRLTIAVVAASFFCVATDSLVRVFMLVPCGLYGLFFQSYDQVYVSFVGAAIYSYVEDAIAVTCSLAVGVPIVLSIRKIRIGSE